MQSWNRAERRGEEERERVSTRTEGTALDILPLLRRRALRHLDAAACRCALPHACESEHVYAYVSTSTSYHTIPYNAVALATIGVALPSRSQR